MFTDYRSSFSDYVDTLGELEGFCDSRQFEACIICGDFNVDFERTGRLVNLLDSFMSSSGLVARDLAFRDTITFAYEQDDGCVRSWIDHILCDKLHVDIVTNIKRVLFSLITSLLASV